MFKNKKVIIFDIDGTLFNTQNIWDKACIEANQIISGVKDYNSPLERDLFLRKHIVNDKYMGYAQYLKEKYRSNLSAREILDIHEQIAYNYQKEVADFKPMADVFVKLLKELGYILAIASSTTKRSMDIYKKENKNISNKCNIDTTFDLILLKDNINNAKPHPEIYLKVLSELKVEASDCLVLEDSLNGVMSAKSAGIQVISIDDETSSSERYEIKKLADYSVDNYEELIDILKAENHYKI